MVSYFALYWVVFMLGILILILQKKKKLSWVQKNKFYRYLTKIENTSSYSQKIIEYDKLYHNILKAYNYHGNFWDILKKKPKIITDIQVIWDLHKLRNRLVHELSNIPDTQLEKSVKLYHKHILTLLNK